MTRTRKKPKQPEAFAFFPVEKVRKLLAELGLEHHSDRNGPDDDDSARIEDAIFYASSQGTVAFEMEGRSDNPFDYVEGGAELGLILAQKRLTMCGSLTGHVAAKLRFWVVRVMEDDIIGALYLAQTQTEVLGKLRAALKGVKK